MAIPESQLETWAKQGSVTQSSTTYGTIKRALEANDAGYANQSFKVFLQGSYGNDTNIYAESDVDVVIRLDSVYYYDITALTPDEQMRFNAALVPATYPYANYKADVVTALTKSFGRAVVPGEKALKIKADGGRRNADVIVATEFKRYRKFPPSASDVDVGMCFFTTAGNRTANYPEQHSANCTRKHQETNNRFKPMVRVLKNMRSRLVTDGSLDSGTAPSYYLEGLLYNVPPGKFGATYGGTFVEAINWIRQADRSKFVSANEEYYLFGASAVQWTMANCDLFLNKVVDLWNNWG
jgi:hypothetical protein